MVELLWKWPSKLLAKCVNSVLSWSLLRIILKGWIISSRSTVSKMRTNWLISSQLWVLCSIQLLRIFYIPNWSMRWGYAEAIKVLSSHFKPQVNITHERFLFNKRVQKEGEFISEYSMQLKNLLLPVNLISFWTRL